MYEAQISDRNAFKMIILSHSCHNNYIKITSEAFFLSKQIYDSLPISQLAKSVGFEIRDRRYEIPILFREIRWLRYDSDPISRTTGSTGFRLIP